MLTIETIRAFVIADPNDVMMRFVLAQKLYDEDGSPDALAESTNHLFEVIEQKPDYLVAYLTLGRVLSTQGHLEEAAPVLKEGIGRVEALGAVEGHDLKPDMEALLESLE